MKVSEVLEKAADICEAGWTKCDFENGGCHCAAGAIARAAGGSPIGRMANLNRAAFRVCNAAWTAMECAIDGFDYISTWNDAPGRTQAEVVAKLREVAALEREAGR